MKSKLAEQSEKLIYFVEVAKQGSLQKASRTLLVSAPSLSQSIKELESALQLKLFSRSAKGVALTKAGEKLFSFSSKMLQNISEIESILKLDSDEKKERVRIGTFQSIALNFWPLVYEALKNDPQINASLTTDRSRDIFEHLITGQIDIALTVGTKKHRNVISKKLYEDKFCFVISGKKNILKLEKNQLVEFNLYYFGEAVDEKGTSLNEYIRLNNLKFKEECEVDSFELIEKFVSLGYGVGILPTRLIDKLSKKINRLNIQDTEKNFGRHSFYISHRTDSDLKKATVDKILNSAEKAVQLLAKSNA